MESQKFQSEKMYARGRTFKLRMSGNLLTHARSVLQSLQGVNLEKPVSDIMIEGEFSREIVQLFPPGVAGVGHLCFQDIRFPDQPGSHSSYHDNCDQFLLETNSQSLEDA